MKGKWIFADWKLPDETDLLLIQEMGFTDVVLGIGDDVDGRFRCKFSTSRIVNAAEAVRALGVRVHLMSWVRRERTFITDMAASLVPLCRSAGASTLMLDAEGHWHQSQGISATAAAALVKSALGDLGCPVGVTGLSNLHQTVRPLLDVCDYGLGQAYSIWKPGAGDHWSHSDATRPGWQQAVSWASWSAADKPLIMGLSNYWAARPARNGQPKMSAEDSMKAALDSAIKVGAREAAYWSLKWLRAKGSTAAAARGLIAAIPVDKPSARMENNETPAAAVQWLLVQLGYNLGKYGPKQDGVDGSFGNLSQQALNDFRRAEGLNADDIYNTEDLTALIHRYRRTFA